MWWPDPIYKILPYLYGAAGAYIVYVADTTVGIVSGTLLATAGAVIWQARKDYAQQTRDLTQSVSAARKSV